MIYFCPYLFFNLANSADTDAKPHYAAFYLCLHFLPKYLSAVSRMKGVNENILVKINEL